MTKFVITQFHNITFLLIYENEILVECHPLIEDESPRIGSIYIGRVEKVVKNIQAAFIRIDEEHVGYLPLDSSSAYVLNRQLPKGLPSIAENDYVLVQVTKEATKLKQARLSGEIQITGDYISLLQKETNPGVSKKIKNPQRTQELKNLITDSSYGIIYRTACENVENNVILSEYDKLSQTLDKILQKAKYEKKIGVIQEADSLMLQILKEYGLERISKIQTDLTRVYLQLQAEIGEIVSLYDDPSLPLNKLLSLETQLQHMLNKKVWLKSGGFLIIEPTEAMVVIDVNSGKSIGKKNKDTHIYETNKEAAYEIVKQLRLRNLSGIIMVDFINMTNSSHKHEIIRILEEGFRKDKIPAYFVEITKLDLFELTRKKLRKPLHELIKDIY